MFTIFFPSYINNNLLKKKKRETQRITLYYKPKEAYGAKLSFPSSLRIQTGKVLKAMGHSAQRDKVTKPI